MIRAARVEDVDAAATVYVASAEHHHAVDPALYRVPDLETCLVRLLPAPSEASMLVFHTAAEVDVAVLPSYRHRGFGRALMEHAERWAAARGARLVMLNAHPANTSAFAFYERLGYQRAGILWHKPIPG